MAPGVDFSILSPAERIIATGGTALFLNGFVPWWYRVRTTDHTYLHNVGLTGWGLLAVLAGFIAVTMVVVHTVRHTRTRTDWMVYLALGVGVLGALGAQSKNSHDQWIGFWLAIVTGVVLVVGALRRRAERHSGWV